MTLISYFPANDIKQSYRCISCKEKCERISCTSIFSWNSDVFYYVCYYQIIFQMFHLFCHCNDTDILTDYARFHLEPHNENYFAFISCTMWWTGNNLAALEIMQHICKMVYVLSSWRVICKQYNVPLIDINEVSLQYCNIHRSVHFSFFYRMHFYYALNLVTNFHTFPLNMKYTKVSDDFFI